VPSTHSEIGTGRVLVLPLRVLFLIFRDLDNDKMETEKDGSACLFARGVLLAEILTGWGGSWGHVSIVLLGGAEKKSGGGGAGGDGACTAVWAGRLAPTVPQSGFRVGRKKRAED